MLARHRGVFFVLAAAILYSTAGLGIKFIPWSGIALNCIRSIVALGMYAIFLIATHHKMKWNRWVFIGSIAIFGTNTFFAIANKMTTAANSIVLQYTAPIFVVIMSALFLKRRIHRLDVIACLSVMMGVMCFFMESLSGGHIAGDFVALLSGINYAVVFLMEDMPDGDPMASVFWGTVISIVIGLPFLPGQPPLAVSEMLILIYLGAFQMGLAFICLMIGLKTTPPVTASLVSGIEPVLNPTLVAIFYGEHMGMLSFIGAAIVLASVLGYQVLLGLQSKRKKLKNT